jgi:hypothetical protein
MQAVLQMEEARKNIEGRWKRTGERAKVLEKPTKSRKKKPTNLCNRC